MYVQQKPTDREVLVAIGPAMLMGTLDIPQNAHGVVLFAHGSGSSRHSPRNRLVAQRLREKGLATLLIDLLTPQEETVDLRTQQHRFNIPLLTERLAGAIHWLAHNADTRNLAIGLFGASTGAGAALVAAARDPEHVAAVVSRGGRADLAGGSLGQVKAPTLLIVGGFDTPIIAMNQDAMRRMTAETNLEIIPRASHLFEEPGALEQVAQLAGSWFNRYLARKDRPAQII